MCQRAADRQCAARPNPSRDAHERVRRSSRWRCICLSAVVRPGRRGRSLLLATRCDRAELVFRRGRARLAHSVCAHEHVGLAVRGRADHGPPAAPTQRSRHVRASTPPVSLPFSSQYPSAPTPNVLQCHRAAWSFVAGSRSARADPLAAARTAAAQPIDGQPSTHEAVRWRLRAIGMADGMQIHRLQPWGDKGAAGTELLLTVWPKFANIAVDVALRGVALPTAAPTAVPTAVPMPAPTPAPTPTPSPTPTAVPTKSVNKKSSVAPPPSNAPTAPLTARPSRHTVGSASDTTEQTANVKSSRLKRHAPQEAEALARLGAAPPADRGNLK